MRQTKLILFDIDGTLTRSHNGFIPFNEAILKTFGIPGDIRTVVPDGNTDPLILEEIFATAHLEVDITEDSWLAFSKNLQESYSHAIREGLTRISPLPGVPELIKELAKVEGLCQGVVTGNLEVTAQLKLEAAGLRPYLNLGAYGSDSRDRFDLPGIAKERWEKKMGCTIAPEECVVVGDTPKDLDAARTNHMRCILVGTGRYPVEELTFFKPDACLSDFKDTKNAVETLMKLFK